MVTVVALQQLEPHSLLTSACLPDQLIQQGKLRPQLLTGQPVWLQASCSCADQKGTPQRWPQQLKGKQFLCSQVQL